MIGEIVTYRAPAGAKDRDAIIADAHHVVPKWQADPDLIRKHFMWSEDGRYVCGFYIWKTRAAAERGHDAAWRQAVEERTGEAPTIACFDVFMILDNAAGTLTVTPPEEVPA